MTNWVLKDETFKEILHRNDNPDDELQSVAGTKKELLPHLKHNPCWVRLPRNVLKAVEQATTFYSLNQAIDQLYNYADDNKIWLGF